MAKKKRYNFAPPGEAPLLRDTSFVREPLPAGQSASPACIPIINARIRACKKQPMTRKVSELTPEVLLKINAFEMDPFKGALTPMIEIREAGAPLSSAEELKEARHYFQTKGYVPATWAAYIATGEHPPFLFEKTSFVNLFNEHTIVMVDMYRPPWKNYYTSDVFFSQWLQALGQEEEVQNLPDSFPGTLYINNITNILTKNKLEPLLGNIPSAISTLKPHKRSEWNAIQDTPHLKCVCHILKDYNEIRALSSHEAFEIKTMQLYRKKEVYNLKLAIGKRG